MIVTVAILKPIQSSSSKIKLVQNMRSKLLPKREKQEANTDSFSIILNSLLLIQISFECGKPMAQVKMKPGHGFPVL